jgi:DNA-binding response OmpR family regulator
MHRILIVDDDPDIRTLVAVTLGDSHTILEAADGVEALYLARKEAFDLVLLDVMMPRMDGFEACRQLKGDPLTMNTPVILLTARGTREDLEMGREAGADDYFVKPFSPTALLDKVTQVLEKGREEKPHG